MGSQCCKPSNVSTKQSSYKSACEDDPEFQQFDSDSQTRTSKAFQSIAVNMNYTSLSLDALGDVTLCCLDMNQQVARFILESEKDIWNDTELLDLVTDYLDSSIHIMNFCSSLEECLDRARNTHSIILVALQKFEHESRLNEAGATTPMFLETLEQLKNFRDSGDPFTDKFFSAFQTLLLHQEALLSKLNLKKRKLDKKLSRVKIFRRVCNMIFVAVFLSALLIKIIAAFLSTLPVVAELIGEGLAHLAEKAGQWVYSMWEMYENVLKKQREILTSMQVNRFIVIHELKQTKVLAEKLQITIKGLLHKADFAIKETDEVMTVMVEIKKNVNGLVKTIDVLSEHANKCKQDILKARTDILLKIKLSKSGSSKQGCGISAIVDCT